MLPYKSVGNKFKSSKFRKSANNKLRKLFGETIVCVKFVFVCLCNIRVVVSCHCGWIGEKKWVV